MLRSHGIAEGCALSKDHGLGEQPHILWRQEKRQHSGADQGTFREFVARSIGSCAVCFIRTAVGTERRTFDRPWIHNFWNKEIVVESFWPVLCECSLFSQ